MYYFRVVRADVPAMVDRRMGVESPGCSEKLQ